MADLTSQSLIDRIKTGDDAQAWSEFGKLYETIIRSWLKRQSVSDADGDDVIQEVMTYVCREIEKFDHNGRPGAFRNWLRRVTAHRMQLFWRGKKRMPNSVDLHQLADDLADDKSGASGVWDLEHDRHVLDHLLSQLAKQFQPKSITVFRRVVLEDTPAQQVADSLEMSLGAVRVAQSRVLQALKELCRGWLD